MEDEAKDRCTVQDGPKEDDLDFEGPRESSRGTDKSVT